MDNVKELSKRALLYHWHKMIELADIADREVRDLVPYSLRHLNDEIRITNAVADYRRRDDGTIEVL